MMRLSTYTQIDESGAVNVQWFVGPENNGILIVENLPTNDAEIAAELVAIKHLVFKYRVFNIDPISGRGVALHICNAHIKKLASNKSSKRHLRKYSAFLSEGLEDVTFVLEQNGNQNTQINTNNVLRIDSKEKVPVGIYSTHALGRVRISKHAIDRYVERNDSGFLRYPKASLLKRLRNPSLKQIQLPEDVQLAKMKKYVRLNKADEQNKTEYWGHPGNKIYFTISRDLENNLAVVLTTNYVDDFYARQLLTRQDAIKIQNER